VQRSQRVQHADFLNSPLHLSIGGVRTSITSADPDLALAVRGPHERFVVDRGPSDIRVEAAWGELDGQNAAPLFDSGGVWRLYERDGLLQFDVRSPTFGPLPYKTGIFERDFSAGNVYLHRPYFDVSVPVYPLEYPLDELVITNWLALGRGVEIHGCAVRDASGAGYLFVGQSGAGKSTIARLWLGERDVTVLSDDRVIIRNQGNRIWMYGTPWHGDEPLAAAASVPLTRGFFLRHSPGNEVTDVAGAQVVARLLACSFPPFFSASGLESTLVVLAEISRLAPFSELGFVLDRRLPDFVRAMA
jgi:hypothetical protein